MLSPSDAAAKPAILIYRQNYLQFSETFIGDHLDSLSAWRPVAICENRLAGGLEPHTSDAIAFLSSNERKIEEDMLVRFGWNVRLKNLVHTTGARMIHAHFLTDAVRIARFARRHGLPLLVTAHGFDATTYDREWAKSSPGVFYLAERQKLWTKAAAIICVSQFIRSELIEKGCPENKLIVRYLGVDLEDYTPGLPVERRRGALFVGRLVEKKGVIHLVEAWKRLPAPLRAQGLTVIGAGPEKDRLHDAARGCPDISIMGVQTRSVVKTLVSRARVLAIPSCRAANGDAEGLPVVIMEAPALGTPIVAFDDGPMREAIDNGESGLLAPALDIQGFSEALAAVLGMDEIANRLSAGGPKIAAAKFDLKKNTAALEREIYDRFSSQELLSQPRVTYI
jgi:colanic acid/amylovoran biosynthesis glycosyltransferase